MQKKAELIWGSVQYADDEENNEIVVTNVKITGIWITSDANNSIRDTAIRLSKEYNLIKNGNYRDEINIIEDKIKRWLP